jgi:hypothetical protein
LLLLLNLFPTVTRWAALVVFCGFAAYSLRAVLEGRSTCGCFGDVLIAPHVMLAFDLLAVAMLWVAQTRATTTVSRRCRGWLVCTGLAASVLVALGIGYLPGRPGMTRERSDLILFDPQTWVGQRVPFLDEIDGGEKLSRGSWRVLFYHHDCPKCQEALRKYEALSRAMADSSVALIELPPFEDDLIEPCPACHRMRLSKSTNWFIRTPCEILLRNGQIQSVILPAK